MDDLQPPNQATTTAHTLNSNDEGHDDPISSEQFLSHVAMTLGSHYRLTHDDYYQWVTPFSEADHKKYAAQAIYALQRVQQTITGLVVTPPANGWPAILFDDVDDQLKYEGLFGGHGNSIINGGSWCSWPVGHLAIPISNWDSLDAAFGHELVHAALSDTGVPIWLQEGLATELETGMGNRMSPLHDLHEWRETLLFWRKHDPETFWSAAAFRDPESSKHAYALAQVMALRLTHKPERLHKACTIGATAWEHEDATLTTLIGCNRATLFKNIVENNRPRGLIERFVYWCFVGDKL